MVISKTPLRISFFGGGTDYPDYFTHHGGAVLSTTIDKYVYITVNQLSLISEYKYKATYSKVELCHKIEEIVHPSIRECIRYLDVLDGIEVHTISDLPAKTGLGSSSTFTVGLLNALHAYKNHAIPSLKLAQEAIFVEQKLIGEKVGVQDQTAAAFGGLNYFKFHQDGSIDCKPVVFTQKRKLEFKDHLLLYYTGIQRFAEEVLKEQIDKTKTGEANVDLVAIRRMVDQGYEILTTDTNLVEFGELLHHAWITKKNLSGTISNGHLDDMYDLAMKAGAIGGKLLGAGGGGFFLFFAQPSNHAKIRKALEKFIEIKFNFDSAGSNIIFMH
ncbi:MAG TPA: hypothetical protein PLZ98_07445 [Chitinophagaceae bacterium]|nr:hypothetical protein [Chitinophagaceae bacterium]